MRNPDPILQAKTIEQIKKLEKAYDAGLRRDAPFFTLKNIRIAIRKLRTMLQNQPGENYSIE